MNLLSRQHRRQADALYDFVTCAAALLASDDEARRRQLESRLMDLWPNVRQTPTGAVFAIRDPALRAMLDDSDEPPPAIRRKANRPSRRIDFMRFIAPHAHASADA